MFHITRDIDFCYGHRLLNYAGKCRHLHGHNGRLVVALRSDRLDDRGMVLDFGEIKRSLVQWIDDHMDHRMILHRDDPVVPVLREMGEPMLLLSHNPTAENIAWVVNDVAVSLGLPVVEVRLWETPCCAAAYSEPGGGEVKISWEKVVPGG